MKRCIFAVLIASIWLSTAIVRAEDTEVNRWQPVREDTGGFISGLVYLPGQRGMLYFGYSGPKWEASDLQLYLPDERQWVEPLPGRGPHRSRGSLTTVFGNDGRPGLPAINRPYWLAHQACYMPTEDKVLFFAGGATFTYEPKAKRWEHLAIPLDQSPPDVMLGSMAWDPVRERVILFGGGYISAHKKDRLRVDSRLIKRDQVTGEPWTPERWTMAEKRATWAFDPKTRRWSRLNTGSKGFRQHHEAINALSAELDTLIGAVRGVALEYGDLVLNKSAPELASEVDRLSEQVPSRVQTLGNPAGCRDAYETTQCEDAAKKLVEDVQAALIEARTGLTASDGWRVLHALEKARWLLLDAAEVVATAPLPRYYGNLVTDTKNKVLVLFGGHGGDRALADTWVFDPAKDQWRQSRSKPHPPPTRHPAMSFDSHEGVVFLSSGWIYDAETDQWEQLSLGASEKFFLPWVAMAYDPLNRMHVAVTTDDNLHKPGLRRVAHLTLDSSAATLAAETTPLWEWLSDKYEQAWSHLPKTQAEYRVRVERQQRFLDNLEPGQWTKLEASYNAQARGYGSFAYDWDRDQLVLWGGGHSAYMGNEVSQYDVKSNLWMESWPPDLPPWPFGSPDGDGWNPPMRHRMGSAHGYHHYAYSSELQKVIFRGRHIYDPDRMRWAHETIKKVEAGTTGLAVDMSGAGGFYTVASHHWYGKPFGVRRLNPQKLTLEWVQWSDTPFGSNDRSKPVFDSQRRRILWYGAQQHNSPPNKFFAFSVDERRWERLQPIVRPTDLTAPVFKSWGAAYSPKHDVVLILPGGADQASWVYDSEPNTLETRGPGPDTGRWGTSGVVYSEVHDVFIAMQGGSYGIGPVSLHFLRLAE